MMATQRLKSSSGFRRKWCDLISGINAETVGSATNTLMEQAWAELCQAQAQLFYLRGGLKMCPTGGPDPPKWPTVGGTPPYQDRFSTHTTHNSP